MTKNIKESLAKLAVMLATFSLMAVVVGISMQGSVSAATTCPAGQTYNATTGKCEAAEPYKVDIRPLPKVPTGPERVQIILTIVFAIIGALSVLMFAVGGLRYVSSQGDPQQISKAKGTLIYAVVGLVVSISAISIVTFVLGRV
ncbi:MAG TPA: pilin [Candidatus Saccharimonadales bacterium]|nr:pilin [Candidatus Saccharimonadales bacterium]